jgi:hypothetical protein
MHAEEEFCIMIRAAAALAGHDHDLEVAEMISLQKMHDGTFTKRWRGRLRDLKSVAHLRTDCKLCKSSNKISTSAWPPGI